MICSWTNTVKAEIYRSLIGYLKMIYIILKDLREHIFHGGIFN